MSDHHDIRRVAKKPRHGVSSVGAVYEAVNNSQTALSWQYPLLKEGSQRRSSRCHVTAVSALRGRSERLPQQVFDLPGRAESKVAFHLFRRRGHPSFKEGILPFADVRSFIHTFYNRPYSCLLPPLRGSIRSTPC
jgi:hypothetical protein